MSKRTKKSIRAFVRTVAATLAYLLSHKVIAIEGFWGIVISIVIVVIADIVVVRVMKLPSMRKLFYYQQDAFKEEV